MSERRDGPTHVPADVPDHVEEAVFSGAIPRDRARPPVLLLLVFGLALAGIVAVGIAGRTPGSQESAVPPSRPVAAAPSDALATPIIEVVGPDVSPDHAPIATSGPGDVQLSVRRHPESLFISGDVFVPGVSWVFVSVQDAGRRIAGWTSVSIPGGAGPAASGGPSFRFAVELALPGDSREGPLLVQANAYSSSGQVTSSATVEVEP